MSCLDFSSCFNASLLFLPKRLFKSTDQIVTSFFGDGKAPRMRKSLLHFNSVVDLPYLIFYFTIAQHIFTNWLIGFNHRGRYGVGWRLKHVPHLPQWLYSLPPYQSHQKHHTCFVTFKLDTVPPLCFHAILPYLLTSRMTFWPIISIRNHSYPWYMSNSWLLMVKTRVAWEQKLGVDFTDQWWDKAVYTIRPSTPCARLELIQFKVLIFKKLDYLKSIQML